MFDFLKIKVSMTTFLLSVDSYLLIFSAALFFLSLHKGYELIEEVVLHHNSEYSEMHSLFVNEYTKVGNDGDNEIDNIKLTMNKIKNMNLFGQRKENHDYLGAKNSDENIDDETLLLSPAYTGKESLVGILVSSDPRMSISIVSTNRGHKTYLTNDVFDDGDSKVIRIFDNGIVVKNKDGYFSMNIN
ncbi:hypothetical protein [Yersinia ruckeri]|uniref:hypothetical protein n=1 Tax=Yersinia ruckeri TaxID=29486 RepID=UPI0004E33ED2|nr:hypothetical protein [Yersinia ruckeri]ARY99986.1 general secretion pathway protein C [Yersinia ruckeri]AUQ42098.1 hypothetical protein NJ56_09375 [Yersinia ruckeri]EKN4199322.1 hypothetical protein [Yersinia ruckeri]EKN4205781.1 hypothetical protein [Yersinia ruckeri]EKN4688452.1 hypothetical protein [Yersinia ruckeri]